jgi:hypothetical protein
MRILLRTPVLRDESKTPDEKPRNAFHLGQSTYVIVNKGINGPDLPQMKKAHRQPPVFIWAPRSRGAGLHAQLYPAIASQQMP